MLSRYHVEITHHVLGKFFAPSSLKDVVRANVGQDTLSSLFGVEGHRHVCDCTVARSLDYIDEEHAQIAELAQTPGSEREQRLALGRLLHTAQDFYAHTNYVDLWLAENGGIEQLDLSRMSAGINEGINEGVNGLETHLLTHESLQIAQWSAWREPFYYVPVVGSLIRWICLPQGSHEAIHLDSPDRGPQFHVAMAIARQRTQKEYVRAVAAIRRMGGSAAVARFHGSELYAPVASRAKPQYAGT